MSRLRNGPAVSLIDLSVGGALLEADVPLRPGSRLTLEIAGHADEEPALAPMRVLRCEIATLDHVTASYRGACEFVRPLELPALMAEAGAGAARCSDSWRSTRRSRCWRIATAAIPAAAWQIPDVVRVLRLLEAARHDRRRQRLAGAAACRPAAHGGRRARTWRQPSAGAGRHRITAARGPATGRRPADRWSAAANRQRRRNDPLPPGSVERPRLRVERRDAAGQHAGRLAVPAAPAASMHLCSLLRCQPAREDVPSRHASGTLWQRVVVRYLERPL